MNIYISFGQSHVHRVNGKTLDKDSLAEIVCDTHEHGRAIAYDLFKSKYSTSYSEEEAPKMIHRFPRGIIRVN
jgi:predicted RNA-binding protein with PUA domain